MRSSVGLFLIGLLVTCCATQQCQSLISETQVFASLGEYKQWPLWKTFFDGSDLSYSIEQNDYLGVAEAVTQLGTVQHQNAFNSIIAFHPQIIQSSTAWADSFAVLSTTVTGAAITKAGPSRSSAPYTPSFNTKIEVYSTAGLSDVCFDFVWIGSDKFLTDCGLGGKSFTNQFYLSSKANTPIPNQNVYEDVAVTKRILKFHSIPVVDIGSRISYVLRGTPYYALPEAMKDQSVIEVFALDNFDTPVYQFLLDGATLSTVVGGNIKLNLVDFTIVDNGNVYILNNDGTVYVLTFSANGTWKAVATYESPAQAGETAFAFSLNFLLDQYGDYSNQIGVLFAKRFVVRQWVRGSAVPNSQTYTLPVEQTQLSVVSFAISQTYVIVQDQVAQALYVYSTTSSQVLKTVKNIPATSLALVDPFLPFVISVSLTSATSHRLSKGYLYLKSATTATTADQAVKVSAMVADGSTCLATLNFQVLAADSLTALQYTKLQSNGLPSSILYPLIDNHLYALNQLASGPALSYSGTTSSFLSLEDVAELQFYQMEEAIVNATAFPTADQVAYSYILSLDDIYSNNLYYFIQGTTDKTMNTWQCTVVNDPLPNSDVACAPLKQGAFTSKVVLNLQTFQAWPFQDQINVALLSDSNNIQAYGCDPQDGCELGAEFKYDADTIGGFTLLAQNLFVVLSSKPQVDIVAMDSFTKISQIDQVALTQLGYTLLFNPKAVYGNKKQNPSLAFIDSGDHLLIVDYHSTLTLITTIAYQKGVTSVQVAVGISTFFLIYANADPANSRILQYNYEDLSNIYLQKTVPLYGLYSFTAPVQGDFSSQSGFFFLAAQDKAGQPVLLVLKPDGMQRDTLYTVIPVAGTKNTNAMVSVNGGNTVYAYVNYGDVQRTYQVLPNALLQVTPKAVSNSSVVSTYSFGVQVNNLNAKPFTLTQSWKILNTQSIVKVNQGLFKSEANPVFSTSGQLNVFQPLSNSIATGQVLRLDIQCPDCGTKILMINKVQPKTAAVGSIVGITDFDGIPNTNNKYAQTAKAIYPVDAALNLVGTVINLSLPTSSMACQLVAAQGDGDYIVSLCLDGSQTYAYLTSCLSDCSPVGAYLLPEVTLGTHKAAFVANSLLVLNSYQNQGLDQGTLLIYNLDVDGSELSFKLATTIDTRYLQSVSPVSLTDFTFLNVEKVVRLFLLDAYGQLFMVDGAANQYYQPSTVVSHINVKSFLNSEAGGQYFGDNTLFLRLSTVGDATVDADNTTLIHKVLLTTNNVAQYVMNINVGTHFLSYQLAQVLNRYGTWKALNRLKVNGDVAVIPYASESKIVYAVYNLSVVSPQANADQPALVQMQGGTDQNATAATQQQVFLYFVQNGNLYVNNPNDPNGPLSSNDINPQWGLLIVNGTGLKSQKITLTAQSDFSTDSSEIDFQGDDSSGFAWYWILLIVLGGVLVLGGIVFCVCKSRKNKVDEDRLLD